MPRPGVALVLLLLCAVVGCTPTGCRQPQRTGIFSLEALSNRDQITNLFHNISSQLKRFSANTTIQGLQYQVANLTAAFYYNDYAQAESIVGNQHSTQTPIPSASNLANCTQPSTPTTATATPTGETSLGASRLTLSSL